MIHDKFRGRFIFPCPVYIAGWKTGTGTQELFEPSALASPTSVIDRTIDHQFCSFRCEIRVNRTNCTKHAKGSKTFRPILIYTGGFFSRERLVYINAILMNKFLQNLSSAIHENIGIKKSFHKAKNGRKISKNTFLSKLPNTPSVKNTRWEYLSARHDVSGYLYVITVSQMFVNDQLLILNANKRSMLFRRKCVYVPLRASYCLKDNRACY